MIDLGRLNRLAKTIWPDEIYNLAAQSHASRQYIQHISDSEVR